MKRLIWIILIPFLFACGPSLHQVEAEKAYYQAKVEIAKKNATSPLFMLEPADPSTPMGFLNVGRLTVFAPSVASVDDGMKQYVQKDYSEGWLRILQTAVSVGLPWLGAASIVHDVAKAAGGHNTSYTTNVAGSNNSASTSSVGNISTRDISNGSSVGMTTDSHNPVTTTTTTTSTDNSVDDHSTGPVPTE
jgi:hypothetical protein